MAKFHLELSSRSQRALKQIEAKFHLLSAAFCCLLLAERCLDVVSTARSIHYFHSVALKLKLPAQAASSQGVLAALRISAIHTLRRPERCNGLKRAKCDRSLKLRVSQRSSMTLAQLAQLGKGESRVAGSFVRTRSAKDCGKQNEVESAFESQVMCACRARRGHSAVFLLESFMQNG